TSLTLDIHLMIVEPGRHIQNFMDAGGDLINVHVEAATHLHRIAQEVHDRDKLAGVSINPATPVAAVEEILPDIDQVMVMSVNPGYSGQSFIESVLPKVRRLRQLIDGAGLSVEIEIDGGVTADSAPACLAAGARVLVAASAVFNDSASITKNMERMSESVARASGGR
ncbi:MAG: ribulose-phosphate 3-epimerase, partial [Dehalococcoidia bacterium]